MFKASSRKIKIVPENLVYFHMKIITCLVFCALTGTFKEEVLEGNFRCCTRWQFAKI